MRPLVSYQLTGWCFPSILIFAKPKCTWSEVIFSLVVSVLLLLTYQGVVTDPSAQSAAQTSQDAAGQQPLSVETTGDHATAYSYQQSKWVSCMRPALILSAKQSKLFNASECFLWFLYVFFVYIYF